MRGAGGWPCPLHLMHNTESRPATSSWSHFVNRSYNLKTCSRLRLKPLPITCFLLEKIWTVQNTCFGTTLLVLYPRSFWINIFITVVFLQIILTTQYFEFKTSAVHLVWNRLPKSKLQFNLNFLLLYFKLNSIEKLYETTNFGFVTLLYSYYPHQ